MKILNIKNKNIDKENDQLLNNFFYNSILPALYIPEYIHFSCTGCGKCCRYEPGFVFLTEDDIKKISNFLKINKNFFLKRFTKKYNDFYSLIEKPDYDCIFWDSKVLNGKGGCTIYKVRPAQCKNYPFWISIFVSKKSFNETRKNCPGFNLSGKKYNSDDIVNNLLLDFKQRITWYKKLLKENL